MLWRCQPIPRQGGKSTIPPAWGWPGLLPPFGVPSSHSLCGGGGAAWRSGGLWLDVGAGEGGRSFCTRRCSPGKQSAASSGQGWGLADVPARSRRWIPDGPRTHGPRRGVFSAAGLQEGPVQRQHPSEGGRRGWEEEEEEEEEGGGFIPLAAGSQGSSGLAGLTPFLHVSSHPCARGWRQRRRVSCCLKILGMWAAGRGGLACLPCRGCHMRPTQCGCTGSWGPSPVLQEGRARGWAWPLLGWGGPSPPSVFGVGEQILNRKFSRFGGWSGGRCSSSSSEGSERPPEHASSRVLWKGHGLGGRCTAVELFGFSTLTEAGIYQMGSETNL